MTASIHFSPRNSVEQVEEGTLLSPKFDINGLLPCVTTDAQSGEVLMVGYLNDEALKRCISTGEAHYYSRSRKKIWHKGETSGFKQTIVEMRIDDDQDCVWLRVKVAGGASCHVGYRSCFYRSIPTGSKPTDGVVELRFQEKEKVFNPTKVYAGQTNPTQL